MAHDDDYSEALEQAIQAVRGAPDNEEGWDRVEQLACKARKVDEVAALYAETLERRLPKDAALAIVERALVFHDEWIGEPEAMHALLERTLELDPAAQWAFDRISLELTSAGRWEDLLAAYDRMITRTDDPPRRAALLEEAAHIAKDSAGKPERAVDYLLKVFVLRPSDPLVGGALERLLRQQRRYRELIDFWNARLRVLAGEEALATLQQIAACWMENLDNPEGALAAVEPLLADAKTSDAACKLLDQILRSPAANAEARRRALAQLSRRWDGSPRWLDVVSALRAACANVELSEQIELHAEIARRLLAHGDLEGATEDLAVLLAADWGDWASTDVEALLRGTQSTRLFGNSVEIGRDRARQLVTLAARVAAERMRDIERAIELLERLLADEPRDRDAIKRLGSLYEQTGRADALLALRRHELGIADSVPMRLHLRLEIARLLGAADDPRGAAEVLRENLAEHPQHDLSVRALINRLEELGADAELEEFLCAQAEITEGERPAVGAELWHRAAELAATHLNDFERAIACYRRVVALQEDPTVFDALANLHLERREHAEAVEALTRRLALAEPGSRAETIVRLANAYMAAEKYEEAARALREGLEEDPANLELRQLLAELHRRNGDWEALASALQEGAELMHEDSRRFELLSEAADIYTYKLSTPERAITVLENARSIAPGDRTVRTRLADALRAAGRLDEARALADGLLEELGRRRVPEKAALHKLLAQIADAKGAVEETLRQLELASGVDVGNAEVQRMLGAAYRKAGQFEKAERAYQALLLILRRQRALPGKGDHEGSVGVAEALFELYRVAQDLGDSRRANEALESAFDAAAQSEAESRRLERVLRSEGTPELLMRALRQRLAFARDISARGGILAELSGVLEEQLADPEQALEALLEAVADLPRAKELHDRALGLARRLEVVGRYRDVLAEGIKRASEQDDWSLACDLLLRAGQLAERDLGDVEGAFDLYARAESTGQRQPEVWRAMARVAAARGDNAAELSSLRNLAELPLGVLSPEQANEVLYRLAELELRFPDSLYSGLETLKQALATVPRLDRAAEALRKALALAPRDEAVIEVYEAVARDAWNDELLLDALQRRAELGGVGQQLLDEAYGIAARLEHDSAAEALLLRAVEVARDEVADLGQALWALRILIDRRKRSEQLEDAVHWMREAAEVATAEESRRIRLDIASIAAGALNRLDLAADTYEELLEQNPGDPAVWKPALEVVRRMGDKERFERLLTRVSDAVPDAHARNQLRVAKARLLLSMPGRQEDACATLQQVLDDDPEHPVAADLLIDQLEKAGRTEDLADLLEKQIDLACERRNSEAGVKLTLRLGALLTPKRRDEALATYRSLLEWVPGEPRVLDVLHGLLDPEADAGERADVLERLLAHNVQLVTAGHGDGKKTLGLALELVRARDVLGDPSGMERALEQAFKIDSRNPDILAELRRLAERLVQESFKSADKEAAIELLQKAASIHWNNLDDPKTAAGILREAHSMQPANVALVSKLVRCLTEIGEAAAAVTILGESLERHRGRDPQRTRLLRIRASVHASIADHAGAVADLEEAMAMGAEGLGQELCDALEHARGTTRAKGDREGERAATMRLAEVLRMQVGDEPKARTVLSAWLAQNPMDRDAIVELIEVDSLAKRWIEVASGYARLVRLEDDEAQADAAVNLADAYGKAGTPEAARDILESLYKLDPANARIRARLRRLYDEIEAYRELSNLILVEANQATEDDARFNLLREAGEIRLYKLNAAATAIGPLMEALDLRPKDQELTLLLADAYIKAGFTEDALQVLQAAIERHGERRSKDLAALQHRMARALAASEDNAGELSWLTAAWESFPQSGELASELADRAMELGDYEVALKALRALAAMRTPAPISRPMALLKQAQIARNQGDDRKAGFLAKKALTEEPNLAEAQSFLQELQA